MSNTAIPRIAIGGILHETHTFMQQPTTVADFETQSLYVGDELISAMRGTRSGIGGMIDRATDEGWQLLSTLYAAAMSAGIVTEEAYRALLSGMMDQLKAGYASRWCAVGFAWRDGRRGRTGCRDRYRGAGARTRGRRADRRPA